MLSLKTLGALALGLTVVPSAADAAVIVNISDVGSDLVTSVTGSIDLSAFTLAGSYTLDVEVGSGPGVAYVGVGTQNAGVFGYSGLSGPADWGGSYSFPRTNTSSGSNFALNTSSFGSPYIFLSNDYVSGANLLGTATYLGQSIASLGLVAGSYVYTAGDETVTVNIGNIASAVPEPSAWLMMIAGFGAIGFAMRRRNGKVTTKVRFA